MSDQNRFANLRGLAPGGGGGGIGRGGLDGIIGPNRELRYNRMLDRLKMTQVLFKVPSGMGVDENNFIFGLGRAAAVAAAAQATLTQNAPRDMILRRLFIVDEAGGVDFQVDNISVEGNNIQLGAAFPGGVFKETSFNNPTLDLPVSAGTPVSVTFTNRAAGAIDFQAGFSID